MSAEVAGFLLNAALFLAGLMAAGIAGHNGFVLLAALASAGSCVICYYAQIFGSQRLATVTLALSWLLAIAGFVELAVETTL